MHDSVTTPRHPPAWIMIATGMLVTLVSVVLARLAYGLILPFMRSSLQLSYQQAGNLGTASALGYLSLVMAAGIAATRWGGRAAVLLGLALITIGFIGLSVSSNYLLMLGLMVLLGFGTAFVYTPVISLLASWFPQRRGAVIGIANAGVGLGLAGAGALVPYLNQSFGDSGWRLTWVLFAAASLLTTVAVYAFLRNPPSHSGFGRVSQPLDKASVYKHPQVVTVGLLYGVTGITYIAQAIFMFSFALEAGVTAQTAGRLTAICGILSILASPSWGWLSDRFERTSVLLLSVALTLLATLIPVIWPGLEGFTAHYILFGCTISGMFTAVLAASSTHVQPHQAPLALSYVTLFFATGQFVGPAIAGLLIEHAGGFRIAFAASCLAMCGGVALCLRLRKFRLDSTVVPAT